MTRRLRVARSGLTDESYAFDARGVVVTSTRYDEELRALGLIPSADGITSATHLELRDPGGDLTAGFQPTDPSSLWPLTRMAALATSGKTGIDVNGYRDFRGKLVVGAWSWLPEYQIGVATEMEVQEAYGALGLVRMVFGVLFVIATLMGGYAFVSTLSMARMRKRIVEARRLGRYRLEEPIGEGGMAKVYRASHPMLQRPCAIKLLKGDELDADNVARFEREVQLVARLNHPNTVQIFDYGETEDGTLFYVMELVPGLTLAELVSLEGTVAYGRVISLLRQACGSLREAHELGIVHRDVKPGNIMVCDRTDGADIVKVLDFGLARTMAGFTSRITRAHLLGGTPAYLAPERIREPAKVDPRSDLYALGAVAFFVLTGQEVVEGSSPQEVLLRALHVTPSRPAEIATQAIPKGLDDLVERCLAHDPELRPQSAGELLGELDELQRSFTWTEDEARSWWEQYRSRADLRHRPYQSASAFRSSASTFARSVADSEPRRRRIRSR